MSVASRQFPVSLVAAALAAIGLFGSAQAQTLGGVSGPAGDAGKVEKCDAPKGTLAVVEPQDAVLQALSRIGLQSPTGMIRLIVQQSNCFQIVERGAAFQNLMQERALAAAIKLNWTCGPVQIGLMLWAGGSRQQNAREVRTISAAPAGAARRGAGRFG